MAEYIDDNTVAFTNMTRDAIYFEWQFSDGTISTEPNPVHEFITSGEWSVTLMAVAELGCVKTLTQEYAPLGDLFIPNCFTPDNDGINDFLFAVGHDLKSYEIFIYNKWGEVVFHSNDIQEPWDGSVKDGTYYVPDGVYPFRVTALGRRDNFIDRKGSITILR
jgi:gliding motility-associated-like protein